jgi:hypothetical protein
MAVWADRGQRVGSSVDSTNELALAARSARNGVHTGQGTGFRGAHVERRERPTNRKVRGHCTLDCAACTIECAVAHTGAGMSSVSNDTAVTGHGTSHRMTEVDPQAG